ncbi:hypothetical protein [Streptomyces sp. NPDC020480]|uniref:hypothetical protein n=1 Tax=Streptomyces sp. NPDC020480 TaxID=3365076 RepID=UPI0037AD2D13
MSDYFDRLLARHSPAPRTGAGGADGRTAHVRPRLPGPYERIESLRAEPPALDEPAPLFAAPPQPAPWHGESVRYEREVETVRDTVVRAEAAPRTEPAPATAVRPAAPLLRPAAQVTPGPRPDALDAPRPGRRDATPGEPGPARRTTAPAPASPEAILAPAAAAAPPSLRAGDAGLGREAARAPVTRRRSKPAERVVHVQIGRLEVSAAGTAASGGGRPPGARPEHAGRRAPALSLQDYLTRGETRS